MQPSPAPSHPSPRCHRSAHTAAPALNPLPPLTDGHRLRSSPRARTPSLRRRRSSTASSTTARARGRLTRAASCPSRTLGRSWSFPTGTRCVEITDLHDDGNTHGAGPAPAARCPCVADGGQLRWRVCGVSTPPIAGPAAHLGGGARADVPDRGRPGRRGRGEGGTDTRTRARSRRDRLDSLSMPLPLSLVNAWDRGDCCAVLGS